MILARHLKKYLDPAAVIHWLEYRTLFLTFALNIEVVSDNYLRKEWKKTKREIISNTNQSTTDTQASPGEQMRSDVESITYSQ